MDRSRLRTPLATVAGASAIALLLAACGGSASPDAVGSRTPAGSSGAQSAVAYASCMRHHGVPHYPDPNPHGDLPKGDAQEFGVSQSQYDAARQACQTFLPTGGSLQDQVRQCSLAGSCSPSLVQQMMSGGQKLARCLREHGVSRWPDPTLGGPYHTPMFPASESGLPRAQVHSPQLVSAARQCAQQPGALMLPTG